MCSSVLCREFECTKWLTAYANAQSGYALCTALARVFDMKLLTGHVNKILRASIPESVIWLIRETAGARLQDALHCRKSWCLMCKRVAQ
jgi:hypothetical protein